MRSDRGRKVAIVDYGMGNLFSVRNACEKAGLLADITSSRADVMAADAVILPGVGAFGDAMQVLRGLDLVSALQEVARTGRPLLGICLGLQMLMAESYEFGHHEGLGIVPGKVIRMESPRAPDGSVLKVPHVCWDRMFRAKTDGDPWRGTLLNGLADGVHMYFVHSFYVVPDDPAVSIATTRYGDLEFCSALRYRNVFACQAHPERSGPEGLKVYRNLAAALQE